MPTKENPDITTAYDRGYEDCKSDQARVITAAFLDMKRTTDAIAGWKKRYLDTELCCGRLQSRLQWTLIGWAVTTAFAVVGWLR
jgi:hypothetical protein